MQNAYNSATFIALLVTALLVAKYHNVPQEEEMIDEKIIPRNVVFSDPVTSGVRLSPNGRYISFIAPRDGIKNIYVAPRDQLEKAVPVTNDRNRGISKYVWAYDNAHLLYLQDNDGDENWRMYSVNVATMESQLLTPGSGIQARFEHLSEKYPSRVLIGLNDRRSDYHDLYILDITTGQKSLVFQNNHYTGVVADDDFNIWFGNIALDDGGTVIYRITCETPYDHTARVFQVVPLEHVHSTGVIHVDAERNTVYLLGISEGMDTNALYQYDASCGDMTCLYQSQNGDISNVLFHPTEHTVQAVETTYLRSSWNALNTHISQDLHMLDQDGADMQVVSRTQDDMLWLVAYVRDTASYAYCLFNRDTKEVKHLCKAKPDLDSYTLAPMFSLELTARDGMVLPSYLTIPEDYMASNDTYTPDYPLPMVVLVHGGPHSRDTWGVHNVHQWLASRGYAVLSVNYRGSVGFGKKLAAAGFGQWAEKMHDDLIDAVNWAVEHGVADKNRVAIMGGSYGGYATLVGLTMTPDVFACGIDIVGPSNLETLVNAIPPYWKPIRSFFVRLVGGDPAYEEGRQVLARKSPIHYVDNIKKPLLIGQGANDPRVKKAESDQIVDAMQEKDIPVTYAVYPDEGHGFAKPENKIAFFALAEKFLHDHVGGSYEPIIDELDASSVQVAAGAVE